MWWATLAKPLSESSACVSESWEKNQLGIRFATYFSELIKILKHEQSRIYNNADENYSEQIFELIDSLARFLQDPSLRREIVIFFESFDTVNPIRQSDIWELITLIRWLEDEVIPMWEDEIKKYGKAEAVRSLFSAFWLTYVPVVSWEKKDPTNPILNLYMAGIEGYRAPFYIDSDKILSFFPSSDESQIFTELKRGRVLADVWDKPYLPVIQEAVSTQVQSVLNPTHSEEYSSFQEWAQRRREKAKSKKWDYLDKHELDEKKAQYKNEFQKYRYLWLSIAAELLNLQDFLLWKIPFIEETLDFLSIEKRLRNLRFAWEVMIDTVTQEYNVVSKNEKRDISTMVNTIKRFQARVSNLTEQLVRLDREGNHSKEKNIVNKSIDKITARMTKISSDLELSRLDLDKLEKEYSEIIKLLPWFRFPQWIPTREEYKIWLYHSLHAQQMYIRTESPDHEKVTAEWITDNTVDIFIWLLWTHFKSNWLTLVQITDLLEQIQSLNPSYTEGVVFPDITNISQERINEFMDTLLSVIPIYYIKEIPLLRDISDSSQNAIDKKVSRSIKKWITHKEQRNNQIEQTKARQQQRDSLKILQEKLQTYDMYWNEKYEQLKKQKRSIENDLESLVLWTGRSLRNRWKTKEQLDEMLVQVESDIVFTDEKLKDVMLGKDSSEYNDLKRDFAIQSNRFARKK
jgi:hypothetical protein